MRRGVETSLEMISDPISHNPCGMSEGSDEGLVAPSIVSRVRAPIDTTA